MNPISSIRTAALTVAGYGASLAWWSVKSSLSLAWHHPVATGLTWVFWSIVSPSESSNPVNESGNNTPSPGSQVQTSQSPSLLQQAKKFTEVVSRVSCVTESGMYNKVACLFGYDETQKQDLAEKTNLAALAMLLIMTCYATAPKEEPQKGTVIYS